MLPALLALACAPAPSAPASPPPPPEPVVEAEPPPPPPDEVVTLVAVGDVLPHRRVKATAAHAGWSEVFGGVADVVQAADLAFANLEGPIAPDASTGTRGEVFNAPASLAPGLADVGFDVVAVANNHVYDQGVAGLLETLSRTREAGLEAVGAGPTCAEAQAAAVVEVRGVRVAFLAAADLSNIDHNAGADEPCAFFAGAECTGDCGPDRDAIHYRPDEALLTDAVAAARADADFVVLSMHWGNEYRTVPLPEYPPLAQVLADAGADVILGHHPHVLQPVTWVDAADGRRALVAFSLGNFVSNMGAKHVVGSSSVRSGNTRDGALLGVALVRRGDGTTALSDAWVEPLWTENNHGQDADPRVAVVTHATLSRRAEAGDDGAAAVLETRRPAVAAALGPSVYREATNRDQKSAP